MTNNFETVKALAEAHGLDFAAFLADCKNLAQAEAVETETKMPKVTGNLKSELVNGIWITGHSEGQKMEGRRSISTSVLKNAFCQSRQKCKDSVCSKCYANAHLKKCKALEEHLTDNLELLSGSVIPMENLPVLPDKLFRFESFGDLMNEVHFINYVNIAKKNPQTNFALWTKNFEIVNRVLKYMDKPENLFLIASSYEVNKKEDPASLGNFDKIFTVYNYEFAKENNVSINCGVRDCKDCNLCYTRNSVTEINEILKSDQKRKAAKAWLKEQAEKQEEK